MKRLIGFFLFAPLLFAQSSGLPAPVAGTVGNCTKIGAGNLVADNGSACGAGGSYQPSILPVPPAVGSFTWVNQGSSTTSNNGNSIAMSISDNSALNWRFLTQSNAYSTPYSIAAFWKAQQYSSGAQTSGLYFTDGTKFLGFEFLVTSGPTFTIRVERIANSTTDGSTVKSDTGFFLTDPVTGGIYARLRNNGTTLFVDVSSDGSNWTNYYSEAVGAYLTPTGYGWGGVSRLASINSVMSLQGWLSTNSATL